MNEAVVDMWVTYTNYSVARERLCAPENVCKLMNGTAKWLQKVWGIFRRCLDNVCRDVVMCQCVRIGH